MNIMGVAIGFVQPAHMIPLTNDDVAVLAGLKLFFMSRLIVASIIFVLTMLFYREHPPSPTSIIGGNNKLEFFESLKILYNDLDFLLMAQAFGIYFGLYGSVSVIIPRLVSWQYGVKPEIQHLTGWMGFTCNIASSVSCFVVGFYLDRYACHKIVAVFLNGGSMIFWLIFILILTQTKNVQLLFAAYVIYGTMSVPYLASGIEQAAEMTSPVPEGTSSMVILFLGNLYGFIFIFLLSALVEEGYLLTTLCVILGLFVISMTLVTFIKTELKRTKAEKLSVVNDES